MALLCEGHVKLSLASENILSHSYLSYGVALHQEKISAFLFIDKKNAVKPA
jgi:hypothetical protein